MPVSDLIKEIASRKRVPGNEAKPFTAEKANVWLRDFPGWSMQSGSIQKEFRFKSYLSGLELAYRVEESPNGRIPSGYGGGLASNEDDSIDSRYQRG